MATFDRKKTKREEEELLNLELSGIEFDVRKEYLTVSGRFYYGEESWEYDYKSRTLRGEEFKEWRNTTTFPQVWDLEEEAERLLREKYIQDDDQ